MNYLKKLLSGLTLGVLLAFTSCQENIENLEGFRRSDNTEAIRPGGLGGKTTPPGGGPGGKVTPPSELPAPNIISQYYPTQTAEYAGCYGWRIEWPGYADGTDSKAILSYFSTSTGFLNSLNQLENAPVAVKEKVTFSLYTDSQIRAAISDLDLWGNQYASGEAVYFGKIDKTVDQIEKWVTNRPSNFELNWEHTDGAETDIEYQEGDFFIFQLPGLTPVHYGGIRIVSITPRVIEVYLAQPQ